MTLCKDKTFSKAQPLWIKTLPQKNLYVWFRSNLHINKIENSVKVRIISTVFYQLWCNGKFCGWGPYRGTKKLLWITEHNLKNVLKEEDNEILFLMHYPGVPSAQRDTTLPFWVAEVIKDNKVILRSNSEDWVCQKGINWEQNVLSSWILRGFCEYYNVENIGNNPYPSLDQEWEKPEAYPSSIFKNFSIEGTKDCPPIGAICKPYQFAQINLKKIPYYSKRYCNQHQQKVEERWNNCNGYWYTDSLRKNIVVSQISYIPPDANKIIFGKKTFKLYKGKIRKKVNPEQSLIILFDFKKEISGFLNLEMVSNSETVIHILHGEQLNRHGSIYHGIEDSNAIKIIPGKIQWTSFYQHGLRYALLVIENVKVEIEIKFSIISTTYKYNKLNIKKIKDDFLKRALDVAGNTVRLCLSDGFMDCPYRERAEWTGDSLNSAEVIADIYSDLEPWRRLIWNIISSNVPGEILPATIPSGFLDKIPIYDFQSVISVCNFTEKYLHRIPKSIVSFIKDRVHTYYNWFSSVWLLENVPGRNFQDWTVEQAFPPIITSDYLNKWVKRENLPKGKMCYDFHTPRTEGINATTNAIWLLMLKRVIKLLKNVDKKFVDECETLYNRGFASFQNLLWDEEKGLVKERMPDLPDSFVPSEIPQYAALSAELLDRKQALRVISYCLDKNNKMIRVLSPYGARFVIEGLLNYGKKEFAYHYLKCILNPMVKYGDCLWEIFAGTSSRCHGWGAYLPWYYYKKIIDT